MNLENLKIANTSLEECLFQIKNLQKLENCFTDLIPDFLQEDFKTFLVGKTLSIVYEKTVTHDIKAYYHKLINKGFDYPIQWNN